jgi:hypothetical protein
MVRTPRAEADATALASRGFGYGPQGKKVVWKKVGCVFLGMYTRPSMLTHGQPSPALPFPAYLVQVVADPIADFPMLNLSVVVVDAVTGELGTQFGGGLPPNGMMGTSCGVTH